MRYDPPLYRPPSEASSLIIQASLGCSWNHCTYCSMYRGKAWRQRPLEEVLDDVAAGARAHPGTRKVFVADGDPLVLPTDYWLGLLEGVKGAFPQPVRVSTYATARNVLEKTQEELDEIAAAGLGLLYVGPESGDDETLRRIAKGATAEEHVEAARMVRAAGMRMSLIFLMGAGGVERSREHAVASGKLATAMDPDWLALLVLSVVPGTPIAELQARGRWTLPDVTGLLQEARWFVEHATPTDAVFRTNHASNYLPLGGRLPADRPRILATLDDALAGRLPLRPEWSRGL